MLRQLLNWLRWEGTLERGPYLLAGLVGLALKHNLDRLVATYAFARKWGVFNYWIPPTEAVRVTSLSRDDQVFLGTMLVLALPFIYVGVVLTVKRLRAAGLPSWLVVLFFAPLLNLAFFLLLSILPSKPEAGAPLAPRMRFLDRVIPASPVGSAAMSLLLTIPFGVLATGFGVRVLQNYGWGLFVGLPFMLGLLAVLVYGHHSRRNYPACLLVAWLTVLFVALALIALAIEGLVCVVMAAPMAVVLAAMGGSLGYLIQARPGRAGETPAALLMLVAFVPGTMTVEAARPQASPVFAVRTAVEIAAAPEEVWQRVVAFSELPEPTDWLFKIGIAYPIRAEIHGQGVGAVRYCLFSTGAFIEPITVWDEPRRLRFSVAHNPAPMQEWSFYESVRPAHLEGFLLSEGGEFLLTPLPGGRVRLEGTTWYEHNLWPAFYWRWWGDWIIHRIHQRVLRHIKHAAEHGGSSV